jgi:hypothetical protein
LASVAHPRPGYGRDDRFFLIMALVMAAVIAAGFSTQLVMGRSSFSSPPLVHLHAIVFFGWVVIYVTQSALVTRGSMVLHRRLGWLAAAWATVMVGLGIFTTMTMARQGTVPFFFQPAYFLVMNSVTMLCFGGLVTAAIVLRKRTEWHRRLLFCAMAFLTGPAFGRLLPMPLLIPFAEWGVFAALMVLPLVGMISDFRRRGSVHAAWWWGIAAMTASQLAMTLIAHSPLGLAIYDAVTAGSPGAAAAPYEFAPPPEGPLITGRGDPSS